MSYFNVFQCLIRRIVFRVRLAHLIVLYANRHYDFWLRSCSAKSEIRVKKSYCNEAKEGAKNKVPQKNDTLNLNP